MEEFYFNHLSLEAAFRYAYERDGGFKTRFDILQIADDFKKSGNVFYYSILIEDLARCCSSYFYYTSPFKPLTELFNNGKILDLLKKDGLWS